LDKIAVAMSKVPLPRKFHRSWRALHLSSKAGLKRKKGK
jgi:hypothetical protein